MLFDLGGVLFHWKDEWLFDEVSRELRIPFDKIKERFNTNISDLFIGKISEKEFWQKIPGADKINPQIISQTFHQKSKLDTKILSIARSLKKRGFGVGILSNITPETRKILPKNWIKEFDHVFFSDQIKLAKPDSEIFTYVTRALSEHEIILIDDKLENVDAAKKYGIDSILFGERQGLFDEIIKRTSVTP